MRCRGCDYRLWNLTSRTCPECGEPFLPSQFDFVPNSVQFCCPHCRQPYYGTGPRGHLVPAAFNCVKCGAAVSMDEMVLLPASGIEEEQTRPEPVPWFDRQRLGFIRAWYATVKLSLTRPGRLIDAVPVHEPSGNGAIGYLWLNSFIVCLGTLGLLFALPVLFAIGGARGPRLSGALLAMLLFVGGATIACAVYAVVWGWLAHLVLRLTGPTRSGRARTAHAIYYSSGSNLLTLIPCLGWYAGWIGWVLSAALMVRQAQRVSGVRAAFAVAGPPVVTIVGVLTVYMVFIIQIMARAPFTTSRTVVAGGTMPVVTAIVDYARGHGGVGPRHVAELLWGGSLLPDDLVASGLDRDAERIVIGRRTIAELQSMPPEQRASVIDQFVRGLPDDSKPYRFGDYVFAHGGVNFADPNKLIWLVIEWPVGQTPNLIRVGQADGSVIILPANQFAGELMHQNALRASLGLVSIPDPAKPSPGG